MEREELCIQVLQNCRAELCDLFPAFESAFSYLGWSVDRAQGFSVDGKRMDFSAEELIKRYGEHPAAVRRGYLHMLLHCLFLHLFAPGDADRERWDLACDMAVEQMIEYEGNPRLAMENPIREDCFRRMGDQVLSAEQMMRLLEENRFPYTAEQLRTAFSFDDHSAWDSVESSGIRNRWERLLQEAAQRRDGGGKRGKEAGSGEEIVSSQAEKKYDYRRFLRQFTVQREEVELDPESFDYIFYHLGMEYYGSMPLIEELEYREVNRLEELVIAIDTSGSCSAEVVGHFLAETHAILTQQENFFRKMSVYFIQCDCLIQDVTLIRSSEDWLDYAKKIRIQGRGGTDFGPVFSYVEELRKQKKQKNLRALLYFTDGDGAYPSGPPDYETAFVLLKESGYPELIPKWARLLLI